MAFETSILKDSDHNYLEFGTNERKYINHIYKLREQYPSDVEIVAKNADGYVYARVPANWFRAPKPPIKREFTEEQKAQMAERMRNIQRNSRENCDEPSS